MRLPIALALALTACCAFGATHLPIEFGGTDPLWQALPTYLPDPTAKPSITLHDGVVTLGVSQAGKGMKFGLEFRPIDVDREPFLVLRYKASGLDGGYALHVIDSHPGGIQLAETTLWKIDGKWHVVAVDLYAAGARGSLSRILTEVQCIGPPAELSFDYIRTAAEPPAGADVFPAGSNTDAVHVIHGRDLKLTPQPKWLGTPADKFGATVEKGVLHLWARGAGKGMKFDTQLDPPLDLKPFRFAAIRYRARDLQPWGDYFLYLGSEGGGMPPKSFQPMPMAQLRDDGEWHVAIVPVQADFAAADLALEVCSNGAQGDVWLDTITFAGRRPRVAPTDVLALKAGWDGARLKQGSFRAIDLHTAMNASPDSFVEGIGLTRWLEAGEFTAHGIPFDFAGGPKCVVSTTDNIDDMISAPVGCAGSEMYVLLSALLPSSANAGVIGRGPFLSFDNPERFVFRIAYADGLVDECVPVCVSSDTNRIFPGIDVYCIPLRHGVRVKRLAMRNRMTDAAFGISAITVNTGAPITKPPVLPTLPPEPALSGAKGVEKPATEPAAAPHITAAPGGLFVVSPPLTLDLGIEKGITVRALSDATGFTAAPGPLFEVVVGDKTVTSDHFATSGPLEGGSLAGQETVIRFDGTAAGAPVRGDLHVQAMPGGEIRLSISNMKYTGAKPAMVSVHFPMLKGLSIGKPDDTWYLWACKGGIISNRPATLSGHYGGEYPLQVMDLFNPSTGGGVALLTYDLADLYKLWHMTKDDHGVDFGIDYWKREFQPGETVPVATTALRYHTGDWRAALRIYRDWVKTWYKPQVPRKQWFRECFNYRQHYAWGELYDAKTGKWRFDDIIKADRKFFGRIDYLHIFDFGQSKIYGRVGDYNHYNELGGLPKMAAAIAHCEAEGVRVGLYIEGYLCDDRCQWGKANVLAADIRQKDGSSIIYPGTTHEHVMCPSCKLWRDHLVSVFSRVARQLKPSGMYCDEFGFGGSWNGCWSRKHGHPVPAPTLLGEWQTTRAIRAAIPPGIANLTEMTPNDVNSQQQDGALSYSIAWADPNLAPHRIDLFRFEFPTFKIFQLVDYNPFTDGSWGRLKFAFFNGDGTWLGNSIPDGFSTDARDFLRKEFAILHDNRDAFTSTDVEPLIPTLRPTIYANRFTAGRKTVWTLFNGGYSTYRGDVLKVRHRAGARYFDAFTGAEIRPKVAGGWAILATTLEPQGVGCIVCR